MTRNRAIEKLVAKGESKTLEFKRSTGELREALQTLCAFANGSGGKVVMTASGAELPEMVRANALLEVARFDRFTEDNDPHGEHDFGGFAQLADRPDRGWRRPNLSSPG